MYVFPPILRHILGTSLFNTNFFASAIYTFTDDTITTAVVTAIAVVGTAVTAFIAIIYYAAATAAAIFKTNFFIVQITFDLLNCLTCSFWKYGLNHLLRSCNVVVIDVCGSDAIVIIKNMDYWLTL